MCPCPQTSAEEARPGRCKRLHSRTGSLVLRTNDHCLSVLVKDRHQANRRQRQLLPKPMATHKEVTLVFLSRFCRYDTDDKLINISCYTLA